LAIHSHHTAALLVRAANRAPPKNEPRQLLGSDPTCLACAWHAACNIPRDHFTTAFLQEIADMYSKALRRFGASVLLPGVALAQQPADQQRDWDVRAAVYGFFPSVGGTTRFAAPGGGEIDIDADDLVRNAEIAFMGSVEAQKGRWGLFSDVIYIDVGDEMAGSTALAQGALPLPPGVTADASLDVEASVWMIAANLRVLDGEQSTFDAFAGVRTLDAEGTLDATLMSPLGPIASASSTAEDDNVDGVIGVKGKVSFGKRHQWFVPFYADIGAGDSDRTSQAATGVGYTTRWGELFATYRYLDYDMKSDRKIASLDFSGPAIGVSYRF
jgi:hypothetical protein